MEINNSIDFSEILEELEKEENIPKPNDIRISTMTATCKTGLKVNLESIIDHIKIIDYYNNKEGIIKIKLGDKERGLCKKDIEKKKKKKVFYNQATIIIRKITNNIPGEINMKIFTNGNIQMTGLKSIDDGKEIVQMFYEETKDIFDEKNNVRAIENPDDFNITDFNIVLINSDYSINFKIKRDILHNILMKKYQIFSSYEPCIYPGVNSKYYWNKDYKNIESLQEGICHCTTSCSGKGKGYGNGKCKKITICIFQSGNVIITGARTLEQIKDAYNFINKIIEENYILLKRNEIPELLDVSDSDEEIEDKKKGGRKIIYLKKCNIKLHNKYKNL